jgi:hypothetical protein
MSDFPLLSCGHSCPRWLAIKARDSGMVCPDCAQAAGIAVKIRPRRDSRTDIENHLADLGGGE